MDKIKEHFEEEAREFDELIRTLIPYYGQMMRAAVDAIPFPHEEPIEALDLGCGTGTLSKAVLETFPAARLTCVDIAENMLKLCRLKLADAADPRFVQADFSDYKFDRQYDAIVSSLALHHLETPEDKLKFARKIHTALKPGGVFVNADVVLANSNALQRKYMNRWKSFMLRKIPIEEVEAKWLPKYYGEDRPISLADHFDQLSKAGFRDPDVIWKYYNFAVIAVFA
jgi:tRNA (cmo5U34)-methyltransferase